ncbi:MAG: hypothetical protein DRI57_07595 [Deltaproteobacteria bacterium]|nr:MAG: hypothetical protein DRI57_07595 [Deltaproteobacteria bacterium]
MRKRGWSSEQIEEAIDRGEKFKTENMINRENPATRHVHPETGKSVVIDDITGEIIHVGGKNFKY